MKIIFAGTPDVALTPLQALLDSPEHEIIAVYTQPDRPAGRGRVVTPSPIKQLALENNIKVEQPLNFKSSTAIETLKNYQADLIVVMAYGLIVPKAVLEAAKFGCINIHVSLLPRWRGAAPIQHAILAGDKETGVTIMQMDEGLDTGDILSQASCEISNIDTSESLFGKLSELTQTLLLTTINNIENKNTTPKIQNNNLKTYAAKIAKQDAKIDWTQDAEMIDRMIRAYNPFPIAYSENNLIKNNKIRIWEAHIILEKNHINNNVKPGMIIKSDQNGIVVQTGKNNLCITKLQLPGKKILSVGEILNAHKGRFAVGEVI